MRHALLIAALPGLAALPAFADDLPLRAEITAATVYPAGAETVRLAELAAPRAIIVS